MSVSASNLALANPLNLPDKLVEAMREDRPDGGSVAALTRAMVQGDEAAYRSFYESYGPRLFRYLLVVTAGDEDAAREAQQAALMRVVRHIKPFRDETIFWNWLTVLARTALADQRRKQRRYFAFLDRFTRHAPEPVATAKPDEERQMLASLEQSLASLSAEERELVEQKYFERLSVRDIAGRLQATEKTVESRLTRVRRKLKLSLMTEVKNETAE